MATLKDIHERTVFVKNFDVFSKETMSMALKHKKIILSGDIDKSTEKEAVSAKPFETIIAFSQPTTTIPITLPTLEKYTGFLASSNQEGSIVSLIFDK